jgi:hypothetical protein
MTKRTLEAVCAVVVVAIAIGALVVSRARGQNTVGWMNHDANWSSSKKALQEFGERFQTSDAMFDALKQQAHGGTRLTWAQMGEPAFDWSGVYTRTMASLQYDLDLPGDSGPVSAKLTPAGEAAVKAKADQLKRTGGEYDPLSDCRPPGTPRWFTEPFLKEWVVTPNQTWLMNEMVNDVRRVYTDGRDHTPEDDAYPSWNGDTIGFWDGDVLVAHTKYLFKGQYQRGVQPNYSEKTTVVERWHKVDPKTLQADVWVFDPVNLAKPWYTRQSWTKLSDDEKQLRLRYWDCRENANNNIVVTKEGTSQFAGFTFVPKEGKTDNAK